MAAVPHAAVGGARSRNRTGTLLPARDFKSLVSTYFTIRVLLLARQEGFEPPTDALEGRCSIQLSYCLIVVLGPGIEPGRHYSERF